MSRAGVRSFVLLALVTGACAGSDAAEDVRPTVRDSAGITIVENPGALEVADRWQLAREPTLEIGSVDDPEQELHGVEGLVRLPNGTMVVANGGTAELRFYGPDGTLVRMAGGEGEGPGEFAGLDWIGFRPPDSLVAYDRRLRRISVFDTAGDFGRSFPLEGAGEAGSPRAMVGRPEEGALLVGLHREFSGRDVRPGLHRDSVLTLHLDLDGAVEDTAGFLPGRELFVRRGDGGPRVTLPPFGRSTVVAAGSGGFWIGDTDLWQLEKRGFDGRLLRLVRLGLANRPVEAADVDRERSRLLRSTSEELLPFARRLMDEVPWPDEMPAYDAVAVDPDDRLWVREYVPEWEEATRWFVFDDEGRLEAVAEAPRSLEFLEAGRDEVVALRRDEFDVEYVAVHRIDRNGSG